jgi:hypothetical protein
MKEEKIILNSPAELYSLPISKIKNTKLYNFSGKYFDQIYEEALKIERSGRNVEEFFRPKIKIEAIQIEIPFNTEFGQKIVVSGSGESLGNWDINKAYDIYIKID